MTLLGHASGEVLRRFLSRGAAPVEVARRQVHVDRARPARRRDDREPAGVCETVQDLDSLARPLPDLDPHQPYLVVLQHPVTTEYGCGFDQINETIEAIMAIGVQTVWLWPNVDAGSDDVSKGLRVFRERVKPDFIHFYRNFAPQDFLVLMMSN